jgi:GT2 family glycosyltransferase
MSTDLIKVALIVPVHNRRETTLQALRSLARVDRSGLDCQIYIVDDGSTDGTSAAVRAKFTDVIVVPGSGDLHYAGGTNRGIEAAMGWSPDYFLLMNDDSVFHVDFLVRLVETAEKNPRSVVGSLLLLWNEPHRVFQVAPKWKSFLGGWVFSNNLTAFSFTSGAVPVDCIVGNSVLVPYDAVRECGGLDSENFPHGWGDVQFIIRLKKAGWNLLIEPRSFVWCEPNTYPAPLKTLNASKVLGVLFADDRHPLNLKRQFVANWYGAPSRAQAILAFASYCTKLAYKSFTLSIARFHRRSSGPRFEGQR